MRERAPDPGRTDPDDGPSPIARGRALLPALLLLACVAAAPAAGQAPDDGPGSAARGDSALRIGVALSGGSARGFAHVGVLRALEAMDVPVTAVAGVSMGAVVGALHAAGYGPDELERLTVGRDWGAFFSEAEAGGAAWPWTAPEADRHAISLPLRSGRPTLPTGLVSGQRVTQLLTRLTWHVHPVEEFRDLPVPFVTVATDLETGEAVPLERGSLPLALRASLAIPSLFTPVRLTDRYLVDGGVSRNLPAEDARRLGADVVVCSDVTEPLEPADSLRTFLEVLTQTISFRTVREAERQRELCDVVVRPELGGLGRYSFDRAESWIQRGDSAARVHEDTLRALAARAGPRDGRPAPDLVPRSDSVVIAGIRFPEQPPGRARYLRRIMALPPDGGTTVARIDREVGRLYDAGLFSRVSYRLEEAPPARTDGADDGPPRRTLVVETTPEGRRELRAGFRFDSHRKAAVLFSVDLPRFPGFGSFARVDARLGEQLQFEGRQRYQPAFAPGFLVGLRAGYRRTPLELRDPAGAPPRDVTPEVVDGRLLVGRLLGRRAVVGVEGGGEWFDVDPEEGAPPPEAGGWLTTAAVLATYDSRDRLAFTRSGLHVDLRVEAVAGVGSGERELVQSWGDLALHVPLSERWTASLRATGGSTAGDAPPLHRTFFLGGAVPDRVRPRRRTTLPGLAPNALRGEKLQRAEAGLQVLVGSDLYLSAGWTGGDVGPDGSVRPSDWTHGFALSAGVRTPLGPIRLVAAEATGPGGPRLALEAGGLF